MNRLPRACDWRNNEDEFPMATLNQDQQEAVTHGEGPLLILAGPGSGKTRVITERIVHLVQTVPGLAPENILALTFTEKAAHEMESRVHKSLPEAASRPMISTFHAFCRRTLDEHEFNNRLLDRVDFWIFLRRRMEELHLDRYRKLAQPGAFLHDLTDFFSRCQDELIEPDDFEAFVMEAKEHFQQMAKTFDEAERNLAGEEIERLKELARAFHASRRLLDGAGCSSLGSLISETLRLWSRSPQLLEPMRARFRYILVDELQDTNYGQVELLRRLASPPFNITAVGDDDQAIYRFRGAAHGAFTMFHSAFPGAKLIYLNRNYRSTPAILHVADSTIAKNQREMKKPPLEAGRAEGAAVVLLQSPDAVSEAAGVAGLVEELVRKGNAYRDIAVLYRAHNYRNELVREFRRKNIPFTIRGLSLLSTPMLRDLLAYFRLIHSPHENVSLTRVLLAPRWRFPEELALEARRLAGKDRSSLTQALEGMDRSLFRQELEATGWPELKQLLQEWRNSARHLPVTALLDRVNEDLGLRFLPGEPDGIYLSAFRKFLDEWEPKSETKKLAEFVEYLEYFLEANGAIEIPESAQPSAAVQMMSVHAAKGLEFPVVFMLSVALRRFPSTDRKPLIQFPDALRKAPAPPSNLHLEEERRLFYVAITRAKERLFISSVCAPGKKASPFIQDLLHDAAALSKYIETIELPAVEREAVPPPSEALPSNRAKCKRGQADLFSEPVAESLHPHLAEWAAHAPPVEKNGKLRLSATAIETYQECPLKFKFSHYQKIPTGPQAALTFGNIMHQAVRRYFELRKHKLPEAKDLEDFYQQAWKSAGFEDNYQEEAYRQSGLEQLRGFVEKQNALAMDPQAIRSEEAFKIDLGQVTLEGRIDQINPLDSKRGNAVELVDYKTGRPRTQKDADSSLQLTVYALAAGKQKQLDPERLTFYNLTNNQTVSSTRTEKDLNHASEEIREVGENIRRLIFPPKPGFACKHCDYFPICPAHEEVI